MNIVKELARLFTSLAVWNVQVASRAGIGNRSLAKAIVLACGSIFGFFSQAAVVTGSGCAIDESYVLTAAHVVKAATNIFVRFEGSYIAAECVKRDFVDDWAILRLSTPVTNIVYCAESDSSLGEKLYVLGYPSSSILGENVKYSEGTLSSKTGLLGTTETFQFSAPIQPGNSGGPIFDHQGKLIGIVLSTMNPQAFAQMTGGNLPQNINFGLHISYIRSKVDMPILKNSNNRQGRSVQENQLATCFVKCVVPENQYPSELHYKKPLERRGQDEDRLDWLDKCSPRLKGIVDFMRDLTSRKYVLSDGREIKPKTEADFELLFNEHRRVEYLGRSELRVRFRMGVGDVFMRVPEYDQFRDICAEGYNALVEEFEKKIAMDGNLKGKSFWGMRLGDVSKARSLTLVESGSRGIWASTVHQMAGISFYSDAGTLMKKFEHVKSYRVKLPKKKFYGNDKFTLYFTSSFKLVGIQYSPDAQVQEDVETGIEDIKRIFEKKYSIRFRRISPYYTPKSTSIRAEKFFGYNLNSYAFVGDGISVFIYPDSPKGSLKLCPWVMISYDDFQKAVNDDYESRLRDDKSSIRQSDIDVL